MKKRNADPNEQGATGGHHRQTDGGAVARLSQDGATLVIWSSRRRIERDQSDRLTQPTHPKEYKMTVLTIHEQQEIDRANTSGLQPVVFVHGLWLLSSSWDRWRALFEEQGYTTLAPGWPDDPDTVEEAKPRPGGLCPQADQAGNGSLH